MNEIIEKVETNLVEELDAARPSSAARESTEAVSFADEALLAEHDDKKIYRRSAAYFLFGFGSNQHSIITDET